MNNFLSFFKTVYSKLKDFYKKYFVILNPTLVLMIICIVVTFALSSTNLLTAGRIEKLAEQNKNAAMAKLIDADQYPVHTEKIGEDEVTYNTAVKGGKVIGYIFTVSSKGYGGDVSVMTAVNIDGTVAAVDILDASGETPGLGQNVTKDSFYKQYNGLKPGVNVTKNNAQSANNEIKAVTGATVSSKAVTGAVNKALGYAEQIIAKGATK